MKVFKSIKWRLQIWYGLILVVVLAGFGFTAYQLERIHVFYQINAELNWRFGILANALRRPPPRGSNVDRPPFDRPPPAQLPENGLPGPALHPPREFHLPPEAAALFDASDQNNFYFIIRSLDGTEIGRSTNQPSGQFAEIEKFFLKRVARVSQMPEIPPKSPPIAYTFGYYRNIIQTLPSGETILVGCSFVPEQKFLDRISILLLGIGGIILCFGLAGGWWISSRAVRPISEISSAAAKISAGDLSQRINTAETESELGKLASVLNSTFARLDAAFAQQKQFASDAAHELRTPVSVLLTQTQTALNRERSPAEYRETVEACQRAAQRMRKLIGALLELARLDAGQEQMKRLRFDFSRTIADCVELVKPLAEERDVNMVTELSPLEITGDAGRLAQVATNLLTNAIQYNRPKGEVRVKLASQGGLAILAVSDTGNGISREDLPHVFKRFYRGDKSRTGGNTGLGLAISKAIVEAHGGAIEVSSEEDAGSTFTVRVPL